MEHHYHGIISDPILSAEGVKQGDVLSSFLFSLSVHPDYCNSVKGLSQVTAVAAVDDFNLVGPIDEVFQAFDTLALVTKPQVFFSAIPNVLLYGHTLHPLLPT